MSRAVTGVPVRPSPMTPKLRDRLARPVVVLYWIMLFAGLGLYTAEMGSSLPLWIGAIAGTVLGHSLALRDYRLWFVAAICGGAVYIGVMAGPNELTGPQLYLTFVPATLCAYASLSDRWSLAAMWFPAVVWMLSILDRTHGTTQVDTVGSVFLGVLALGFIAFLRARESRRVGIWTRVAPTPIAEPAPQAVLKESPGAGFMRAGWMLGVSLITFAITAWVAPHLWKLEVARHHQQIAMQSLGAAGVGLPCCPLHGDQPVARTRIREYLDLGRGHDLGETPTPEEPECRVCPSQGVDPGELVWRHGYYEQVDPTVPVRGDGWRYDDLTLRPDAYGGGGGGGNAGGGGVAGAGGTGGNGGNGGGGNGGGYTPTAPRYTQPQPEPAPYVPPAPQVIHRDPLPQPRAPEPTPVPQPRVPTPPPPPPQPSVAIHTPTPTPPAPAPTPPSVATPPPAAAPAAIQPRQDSGDLGGSLLHWLTMLVAFGVVFQVVNLSLRPLRRAITLRHLRSPMWAETVDQRVSNSWQLALVGLRDGGWRVRANETPSELARRVGIADLAQCATILERARYGIQIDVDDLETMKRAADETYREARDHVTPTARAMSWLRWPLV